MKKCTRCKLAKDRLDFYKSKKAKDGLQSRCMACVRTANKRYAKTDAFKESIQKYHNSPKGYYAKRLAQRKYEHTLKGKITNHKYKSKNT